MSGRRVTQKSMTYLCMMFRSNGYGQLRARGLNQHYIDNKDNSQLITARVTCIHNSQCYLPRLRKTPIGRTWKSKLR